VSNRPTHSWTAFLEARRRSRRTFARRTGSNHDGFALVAVIWSLGLITLLGTAVMVGARYRTRVSSNYASAVTVQTAAESALNFGIATALTAGTGQKVKFPLRCRMPGGEHVVITLEEETGKVDLNSASPAMLARFFTALTRDQSLATRITGRIVEFRTPKAANGKAGLENAPTAARFTTVMQLDQIEGISPRIFRSAVRLATVRSGRPEPDMDASSPNMRRLLGLEQKPAAPARGLPTGGSVTIRADVRSPDNSRYIREALVSLGENGRPYLVREWRHGDIDLAVAVPSASRDDNQGSERNCLRTTDAAGS
jgi:general secretion pathway protein K